MTETRPDPDRLLSQLTREHARGGRLKVYFGAAPGVGKTYAMLREARRLAGQGVDVAVGVVETHGRSETEALAQGLPRVPLRVVEHGGRVFGEFDLEAALRRRPQVLLVDELAHSNLPGGRHTKRWHDVRDLLDAGIDVHGTLNVQHLESVHDIVARVTGVDVRETVPDDVLDRADEIELIDLPPDSLLERLRQGKVYVPEAAERAMEAFFRKGNLVALRELALRRTAQRVDAQLADYRRTAGIRPVWPAGERMLVCVGPSPHSQDLLRTAHRLSVGMAAPLFAVFVASRQRPLRARVDRERVLQHLALAESLGARVQSLQADRPVEALIAFAREHNVQRILVGKTRQGRLRAFWRESFMSELIRRSGDIEVVVLGGEAAPVTKATVDEPRRRPELRPWLAVAPTMALAVLVAWLAYAPPDLSAEATLLLLGVVATALRHGRGPALAATLVAVAAFNFLFTTPRFTFLVDDPSHLVTFAIMLVVGMIVGTLGARVRREAESARARQQETETLYSLARGLGDAASAREVAQVAAEHVADAATADVVVLLAQQDGALHADDVTATAGVPDWLDAHEFGVARLAFDQRRPTGAGTGHVPGARGLFQPLLAGTRRVGVLALRRRDGAAPLQPRQQFLLQALADQVGRALERLRLLQEGHAARLRADTERLRNALLASVSHDLRTPLATICGAAGTLVDETAAARPDLRRDLARSILTEAERLNDLVGNVVHATRLDSERVEIRCEWTSIEEVLGNALRRVGDRLAAHRVRTDVPGDLPLLQADPVLLEQAFFNLLDNVARHTPAGTTVRLEARVSGEQLVVLVADDGPGPAFDSANGTRAAGGLGLGLVVVRGIVKAHAGVSTSGPGEDGRGTTVEIRLPLPAHQPSLPDGEDPVA